MNLLIWTKQPHQHPQVAGIRDWRARCLKFKQQLVDSGRANSYFGRQLWCFLWEKEQSGEYPRGNSHIPPRKKKNHLQKWILMGYVSSLEGTTCTLFGTCTVACFFEICGISTFLWLRFFTSYRSFLSACLVVLSSDFAWWSCWDRIITIEYVSLCFEPPAIQ